VQVSGLKKKKILVRFAGKGKREIGMFGSLVASCGLETGELFSFTKEGIE
jgi:hypothetical protein